MRRTKWVNGLLLLVTVIAFFASCSTSGPGLFARKTAHELYGDKITEAGLRQTELGRRWFVSAEQALSKPLMISLPYLETGYFPADQPQSTGLQFSARRGERLKITLQKKPSNGFLVYMDLWQRTDNSAPKLMASSDTIGSPIEIEVGKESQFILRIQPELLKGGEYTVSINSGPSLAFPVPSKAKPNIGSFWGAGRDNGARKHEGIDIFAPFRTPVIAASNGYVTRVEETSLGGKVVWLRPAEKQVSLYYAHLDSQLAKTGQPVKVGDTLGLMGNTGNARTTPTHLHFGIYAVGGAIDPLPFINPDTKEPAAVSASLSSLGKLARTESGASLFAEPDAKTMSLQRLLPQTLVSVKAATKSWYKIALPSGQEGFIASSNLTAANKSLRKVTLKTDAVVFDYPDTTAARKSILQPGKAVDVLAVFDQFYYVNAAGTDGWMLKKEL